MIPDIPEHFVKQGNLLPPVRGQCFSGDGKPQPLGAAVVRFRMWTARNEILIDSLATVIDAPTGKVQYDWQAGDTARAGTFLCEFVADFGGGKELSFPNDANGRIVVTRSTT